MKNQWITEHEEKEPMSKVKFAAIAVGGLLALLLIIGVAGAAGNKQTTPAPRGSGGVVNLPVPTTVLGSPPPQVQALPSPPASLPPVVPVADTSGVGEGVYEVGPDVPPGKYKTTGPIPGDVIPLCYYARLRHNDGAVGDIIQNNNLQGPGVVTIKSGEYFQTSGCATWVKTAS